MSEKPVIARYNPNICWGQQHVEVTLKAWSYEGVFNVDISGNCRGFDVIEAAILNLYESLTELDLPSFTLVRADGNKLICEDEEDRGEEWLKKYCVSVRITGWTPPTVNEVRRMNGADPVPDGDKPWVPLGDYRNE